jgi:hypothetical protein
MAAIIGDAPGGRQRINPARRRRRAGQRELTRAFGKSKIPIPNARVTSPDNIRHSPPAG